MKKICLLIIMQTIVFAGMAQKYESENRQRPDLLNLLKEKQEFEGYTIRLLPATSAPGSIGSYGFDILKDHIPVVHQFRNPVPFFPGGIQKKADAYKIAQWIIGQYKKTGHWQNIVPPHVARELNIEIRTLSQTN